MKNVVGLFDNMNDAEAVVRDLHQAGVAQADISFAGRNPDEAAMESNQYIGSGHSEAAEGAGFGATGGTVVGGLTGLLVGLGALAIPGIGPVVAAGTLATALGSAALGAGIGAATGGLLGALVGAGIPEEDAHVYSEGIRRGGALVMAKVDDGLVDTTLDVMERHNVVDIDERGTEYRSGGWSRFDPNDENYRSTTSATLGDSATTGDNDYDRSSKVGTAGGAVAGAATGATLGSAGGPIGTVVGGVAGAVVGGGVGAAGDAAGVEATDNDRSSVGGDYNRSGADYGARDQALGNTGANYSATGSDYASVDDAPTTTPNYGSTSDSTYSSGNADTSINAGDYDRSSKAGTAGGTLAGAATGAAIGSAGGPVGTVVGGIAGAVTGGGVGAAGDAAGAELGDNDSGSMSRDRSVGTTSSTRRSRSYDVPNTDLDRNV